MEESGMSKYFSLLTTFKDDVYLFLDKAQFFLVDHCEKISIF